MDIRLVGRSESSKGIFNQSGTYIGSKIKITHNTVGIITFGELDPTVFELICNPKTYESFVIKMDPIDHQCQIENANNLVMYITLYEIDEHGHS
jgi:hypothetical protein